MSDLAPDAPDQYTVQKGDTLWGIASKFLKDPWRWPQIWEMNRDQIKDPHWIYPGNVIRLDRSGASPMLSLEGASGGTEAQAQANIVKLDPRVRVEPLQEAIPSIPGSVIAPFLSQPLVIEAGGLDNAPSIVATTEDRVVIGAGDVAYVDRVGSDSGLNWQVFRPGVPLHDPDTGEILGYEAKYVGDARVRRFGNPTTIEITKARQEINRGDRLAPARETAFPNYIPHGPDKPITGAIMTVDKGVFEFGQWQVVTINRGARDGVEVGHVLASYHRGALIRADGTAAPTYSTGWTGWTWGNVETKPVSMVPDPPGSKPSDDKKGGAALTGGSIKLPDERNGLIFVFRVFEKMSYGLVMRATSPIALGDLVQTP
jgi:hypothetical protein